MSVLLGVRHAENDPLTETTGNCPQTFWRHTVAAWGASFVVPVLDRHLRPDF